MASRLLRVNILSPITSMNFFVLVELADSDAGFLAQNTIDARLDVVEGKQYNLSLHCLTPQR